MCKKKIVSTAEPLEASTLLKLKIPVPFERLAWFQGRLGLGEEDLREIRAHRELFLVKKREFPERLLEYFYKIPETRAILDHEKRSTRLKKVWAHWYGLLFDGDLTRNFLNYLWRSGLRHVEIGLDQRFINLAYAFARQFLQEVGKGMDSPGRKDDLFTALHRIIDFCLLIETSAYVTATSQCDMEVVRGMSHQVRNPLTIIGGNILRLQRGVEPGSGVHRVYETILVENRRLEHLVRDVAVYSELFQKAPIFQEVYLEDVLMGARERLSGVPEMKYARFEVCLDPEGSRVHGDAAALETMFYHLLQNSIEALDAGHPLVRISSRPLPRDTAFTRVEIFNTGKWPGPKELSNVFVPFYSTKPYGTGFGLPIAQVVARKSLGDVLLEPLPGEGTRCMVTLQIVKPLPPRRFQHGSRTPSGPPR